MENNTNIDPGATGAKTERRDVWHVFDQARADLFGGEVVSVKKLATFADGVIRRRGH